MLPLVWSLVLALAVTAKPITNVINTSPVTLPLSRKFNFTGTSTILQRDQARAAALKDRFTPSTGKRAVVNTPADNVAVVYSASVGIGSPATQYDLLVDTGSSNTWVGAGQAYVQTPTSSDTGLGVSVTYGSGFFEGEEFIDQVTIGPGLVIPEQSIGVANDSVGFDGFDGILGIGPVVLTQGTLSGVDTSTEIPTVTDNLFASGALDANLIGISFNPTNALDNINGELTWGGVDTSKFTGSISFVPVTQTSPSTFFWGIDQSITYGASTSILTSTAGIVDTGTTLILIATDALTRYRRATGAVQDNTVGLLRITTAQFANLQPLVFHVGGASFSLPPNGQIWPRALNTAIGGRANQVYLIVADLGSPTGEGFDFVNGYTFLERFYSVFDTTNNRVGLATTPNTNSNLN